MTKNNSPTIKTKGLGIKELFKLNSDEFKKKEESRIGSRIKKISFINELLIEFFFVIKESTKNLLTLYLIFCNLAR